jgi:hypothetical protein
MSDVFVLLGGRSIEEVLAKESCINWMPVAYVCNPSYSGGRDQKD